MEFLATSDASSVAYATVMVSPTEGYLLGLDMGTLVGKVRDEGVVGGPPRPTLEVPLADAPKLAGLDAPVDRVVPCPAPHLCYLTAGRLVALNTQDGTTTIVRGSMEDLEPFRWRDLRLGYAWHVQSVQPCVLLAVAPATQFNEMALQTAFRMVSVTETRAVQPVGPDVIGMVGYGPYRWPGARGEAVAEAAGPPKARLEKLEVHAAEGRPPEAIVFLQSHTYAVARDGSLAEWRGSLFRADAGYQLSADREVLLVNARSRPEAGPPAGPAWVFTRSGRLAHPCAALLSADGQRVWPLARDTVECYDTSTGELKLRLPMPWGDQRYWEAVRHGVEFGMLAEVGADPTAWLIADEPRQAWVKILPLARKDHPAFRYVDGSETLGALSLWRGPHGGALVVEDMGVSIRLHVVTPERVAAWLDDAQPVSPGLMVAARWPLDPLVDVTHADYRQDMRPNLGQPRAPGDDVFWLLRQELCGGVSWSRDGQTAIMWFAIISSPVPRWPKALLVKRDGTATVLPDGYHFVDFATDGESLLAVVARRLVEPTAPAEDQVLVKVDPVADQVTWTSQPFARCVGMVPYPAFDLTEFHGAAE